MKTEPILKLAMLLHENPGAYAILIGSGASKAAGILTGWEIVLNLIDRLATLEKEDTRSNPEKWYKQKFGQCPRYDELLDILTTTSTERMLCLNSYFEQNEEEKEQGLKAPTKAHRAIAELVKLGYIRMILTTNFDKLIETALKEKDITLDIISSENDLKGAIPYVHSHCTLIKLNGDYRDTRIKNTPEELAKYSPELNKFLDRIFDEFGLVICGWSGSWDTALREAIMRCPTRRFTTFFLAKDELSDEAQKIKDHRKAEIITIKDAEDTFTDLLDKIQSLQDLEYNHPISRPVAVATLKRYLTKPEHRIRLHDLFHAETEKVYRELVSMSGEFEKDRRSFDKNVLQQRLRRFENLLDPLIGMFAALSYYDRSSENAYLLTECIERLLQLPMQGNFSLQFYPALLLAYAGGICALERKNFGNLSSILLKPKYREYSHTKKEPAISRLDVHEVFKKSVLGRLLPIPNAERSYIPGNYYLFDILKPILSEYIPDNMRYEEVFDIFEYLLGLVYMDLMGEYMAQFGKKWSIEGIFAWRYWTKGGIENSPVAEFIREGSNEAEDWGLLKAGFFGGSMSKFQETTQEFQDYIKKVVQGH